MNMNSETVTDESINICGLLVHTRLENAARVQELLEQFQGVEIHSLTDDGRLVVTIENDDPGEMVSTINNISTAEGVISAAMVYQHHE